MPGRAVGEKAAMARSSAKTTKRGAQGEASKLDARKMMEMAVSIMRVSIPEPRDDGKASPLVGAVLVKADGMIESASRGELRQGDHAEFTLLERKNRSNKLDGAVLFSTLEPCAPGSRRDPKLSCAERIVLARIEEVWVGLEDPDPTVDRKGIKYLQDSGVKVRMFDRDLQEAILDANKDFIEQAEARAAEAREKKEPIVLSKLEEALAAAQIQDFDDSALERYRELAGIPDPVGSESFSRRLLAQGLLREVDGRLAPTGFGLVLFGREPRASMPQAGLLGTIHLAGGREETRDFEGPAVFAPEQALQWLKDKLPNPIDRTQAQRRDANEALFEILREGIVNALVHRDFAIEGAKCQVAASPEKIVVMSPGSPVEPITMEQLRAFDAPMLSRNPVLHFVFAKMKLAEERGLGLKSMRTRAAEAGLPPPNYSWEDPYVVLTLYPSAESVVEATDSSVLAQLSTAERSGWAWLAGRDTVTSAEYAAALGLPNRTALNHLKRLTGLGLLRRVGAGPATRYEVVRP